MQEVIFGFIDLIKIFIDFIFSLKIEIYEGFEISFGILIISFLFVVLSIYYIINALGIIGGDE